MKAQLSYQSTNEDHRLDTLGFVRSNTSAIASHTYGYRADGLISSWQRNRDGTAADTWHYQYDATNQLLRADLQDPSETILQTRRYAYDRVGNLLGQGNGSSGLRMGEANNLNQLTATANGPTRFFGTLDKPANVTVDGAPAQLRTIDHQGVAVHTFEAWLHLADGIHEIPITATDGNQNTATKTYEVTVAGGTSETLAYDLNGNLTSRTAGTQVTTYDWDANNQLIAIHYPAGGKTEFAYDGLGRRVGIIEKDATDTIVDHRRFLWDGMTIIEERNGENNAVVKRFFDHGFEVVSGPDAGDYFTTFDHLGSIREIVNDTETVITRYDYDPYGNVEKISGTLESDFLFTGHFHHARTGLHLAPFRAYDPGTGRWLSRDPLSRQVPHEFAGPTELHQLFNGYAELLPFSRGLYAYGPNNPVNGFDPDGKIFFVPALIIAAKVAAKGAAIGVAAEIGMQAVTHGNNFDCWSKKDLGIGAAQGALGLGAWRNAKNAYQSFRTWRRVRNQFDRRAFPTAPAHEVPAQLTQTAIKGGTGYIANQFKDRKSDNPCN